MSNKYESFRNDVVTALRESVVKVSKDGARTSYTWSMTSVFDACGKACGVEDTLKIPSELKDIIRFEFNKLKDNVMSGSVWEHKRSSETYALADGSIEKRRNDLFVNDKIPIHEQLRGAQLLLDRVGKQIAGGTKNAEHASRLNKRQHNLLKEIGWLRGEIESQAKAIAEANATAKAENVPVNADSNTVS